MRNKSIIPKKLCYLCGQLGADTKDHVPPKNLFETTYQRLTLPAHKHCNNEYSGDEEYFRDVFIQQAAAFQMPNIKKQLERIYRSWNSTGKARFLKLQSMAKKSPKIEEELNIANAVQITPDFILLNKVGVKIARGVIYNDTGVVTKSESYAHAYLPILKVPEVKEKDSSDLYWRAMCYEHCMHTIFAPHYAARRIYFLSDKLEDRHQVTCMMGLMLGSGYFVIITQLYYDEIKNKNLQIYKLSESE